MALPGSQGGPCHSRKTHKRLLLGQDSAGASNGCRAGAGRSRLRVSSLSDATAGAHPARCDHRAPTSAPASGEVTRSSCDAPSHQLTEAAGASHPGPRPSQLLHSGSSRGATQRWHDQREDASGPPGRGGTTEGHGEEGKGSVGRWTTALAADPSLLASKMEPVLRDASPRVLGGLRRHSTWSAEKHLC